MTNKFLSIAIGLFILGVSQDALARAVYCTNCSNHLVQALERVTNVEQLKTLYLEYAESIQQTANQFAQIQNEITMITDMIHNTAALPRELVNKTYDEMTRLAQITNSINTIRADIEGLEQIFDETYKTQEELGRLAELPDRMARERNIGIRADMKIMNEKINEATKATFQVSGKQLKDLEDTGQLEQYINDLVNNADGRNEMLMAANELSRLQLIENKQLRELMATHIQENTVKLVRDEQEKQLAYETAKTIVSTDEWNFQSKQDPF